MDVYLRNTPRNSKSYCLFVIDNKMFFYTIGCCLDALYVGGNGAKHNLISPNDATSYLTISGKSLPKYISK